MWGGDTSGQGLTRDQKLSIILWLMNQFERYRYWTLEDLNNWVFPAVDSEQCHVFMRNGSPVGYVSWAFLDPKISDQVMTTERAMRPSHWRCGEEMWIVEFIALKGNVRYIVKDMKRWFPGDAKRIRNKDESVVRGKYGFPVES